MDTNDFDSSDEITWCPGCGNFGILSAYKKALAMMALNPRDVLLVSGIGQSSKLPHYVNANVFNGLHGRALPAACAAKIANPRLTVLVATGDGDCYGEGGNHFIHNIRRNVDITVIVHNNQIYGLTKGQASPTSDPGFITPVQNHGVISEPFHALAAAIVLGAGFVARGYAKDLDQLAALIVAGVNHKGFSLIEVLQPCVTFNKKNTYEWYSKRVYAIDADNDYNPADKYAALKKTDEWDDRIPTGILFQSPRESYEQKSGLNRRPPLVEQDIADISIDNLRKYYI